MWQPAFPISNEPLYYAIADSIQEAIAEGQLAPGEQLPTQRALARTLGVTVGTISRAIAEAQRRGLLVGEVGRGTFVRSAIDSRHLLSSGTSGQIEMHINLPAADLPALSQAMRDTFQKLVRRAPLGSSAVIRGLRDPHRHGELGAKWLARCGLTASPDQVLLFAGAQHALLVAFLTLLKPGDLLVTEEMTYPGVPALAGTLGLQIAGIPLDAQGLIPEALEDICKRTAPRVLYCVPTLQEPTAALMSLERRKRIAEIARRYRLFVVEDDCSTPLFREALPPLSALLPDQAIYLADATHCLWPALRTSYLYAPKSWVEPLQRGIRTTLFQIPLLEPEVIGEWIENGSAETLLRVCQAETERRYLLAREKLEGLDFQAHPAGTHLWLRLPEPWRAGEFVAQAREHHILLAPAEQFIVGQAAAPQAVRIAIGAPGDRDRLSQALTVLADMARGLPYRDLTVI